MKPIILTVTLNPAVDKIIEPMATPTITWNAGGKGINVARVLKKLGGAPLATGVLAGWTGQFIEEQLKVEGIPSRFVTIAGQTRINTTVIQGRGEALRTFEKGPAFRLHDAQQFKKELKRLLKNCRCVVFSGREADGTHDNFYYDLITMAKQANVPAGLDTHGRPFALGLKAKPFFIKPNQEEAEPICGEKINSRKELQKALKYFYNLGVANVFITLGAKGAGAFDGKNMWFASPPEIIVHNTLGCGDAFVAGFLSAWQNKWPFEQCFRLATAAGTANAMSLLPGNLTLRQVMQLFRRVKPKRLS